MFIRRMKSSPVVKRVRIFENIQERGGEAGTVKMGEE
jgi:hypothetical protein